MSSPNPQPPLTIASVTTSRHLRTASAIGVWAVLGAIAVGTHVLHASDFTWQEVALDGLLAYLGFLLFDPETAKELLAVAAAKVPFLRKGDAS